MGKKSSGLMDPNMMAGMMSQLFDSPMVSQVAFHPQTFAKGHAIGPHQTDGFIQATDGTELAYRLYRGDMAPKFVVLYFHANAETIADVGQMIGSFYDMGCAVLACSFRGFAWSTGQPMLSKLCPDTESMLEKIPAILEEAGLAGLPTIAYGRSLGASCAVHAAVSLPEMISGVCLDAGLQTLKDLPMIAPLMQMIPNAEMMIQMVPEPIGTLDKCARVTQPILFIHGTVDEIIPHAHAVKAHGVCPAAWKRLQSVPGAGHNDLHHHCQGQYWEWFGELLAAASGEMPKVQVLTEEEVSSFSVKDLKKAMTDRGIDFSLCVEKSEMQQLLISKLSISETSVPAAEEGSGSHNGMVPDVD